MNKATEFIIRPARANDVTSIARVHIETWRTTYSDILPDEFLANLSIDQRICQWTRARQFPERNFLFVAEAGSDGVIGFVDAGPL